MVDILRQNQIVLISAVLTDRKNYYSKHLREVFHFYLCLAVGGNSIRQALPRAEIRCFGKRGNMASDTVG